MLLEAALAPHLIRRLDQLHSDWTDDTLESRERRQQQERNMGPIQLKVIKSLVSFHPILKAMFGITKVAVWLAYMANKQTSVSLSRDGGVESNFDPKNDGRRGAAADESGVESVILPPFARHHLDDRWI